MHMWLLSSSGQYKMQTADCRMGLKCRLGTKCRLQTEFKMQTETQIVASSDVFSMYERMVFIWRVRQFRSRNLFGENFQLCLFYSKKHYCYH